MPEIKNTFLAGKMNKSLDDRLLPEGEYRDALNIQVTKSEGADVGVIQNIKGNQKVSGSITLDDSAKVIGSCFDDQNNVIYYFVHQNVGVSSKIIKYDKKANPPVASEIISSNILAFDRYSFVQANVVENYLFFTDGVNEPRKIDTTISYDSSSIEEYNLTVAKPAPQHAPTVSIQTTDPNAGNYIEEKFVRFAYRYKFSDNTYSVYSPFSNIVFGLDTDVLTEDQIKDAYSKGELDFLTNKAKTISVQAKSPGGAIGFFPTSYGIVQVDILMKSSDSPAVMLLDSVQVDEFGAVPAFIYNSEKPKITLPENQLIRVYDEVPKTAIAQEIVGNRVVYGNFTQGFDINTRERLPFVVKTEPKNINYLGVKSNRTYEVGIIFSDDYGRTSPVMFGQNKSITLDKIVEDNYNLQLALEFNSNIDYIKNKGFKYYSVVVKQTEQEYYNVYTPGFAHINGRTYFSIFGDNINKIPIDTSTYNSETNINSTKTKVSISLVNKSFFNKTTTSSSDPIKKTAIDYDFANNNQVGGQDVVVGNFTNIVGYATVSHIYNETENLVTPFPDGTTSRFVINNGVIPDADQPNIAGDGTPTGGTFSVGFTANDCTGVVVFVDGVEQSSSQFDFDPTDVSITFAPSSIPSAGQTIVVFFQYDNLVIPADTSRSAVSLTEISGTAAITVVGEIDINVTDDTYATSSTSTDIELTSPVYGNLEPVKITGIGNIDNFSVINNDILNASTDLFGIYKKENKYLLGEIDGEYGVQLYNTQPSLSMKYTDLGILETKGFESVIDIYYETATQGLINELENATNENKFVVRVNYFNCINLKTPSRNSEPSVVWQESRIRGGFNETSMDYGVQAYLTNEDYGLINRKSSLIYSGVLNNNTKVNNTNQFPSGEEITRTLDPTHGSIQKLYADTDDLLIFQEEKVSKALIDKDIIYTAEGQGLTTEGENVITLERSFATNYGIGKDPQSFAVYAGRKYFVDRPKGAVLRLSGDGITEISNYGMRSYFREELSNPTINKVIGSWDIYNKEYILTIDSDSSITLGFDESNNGWVSRYSYIQENGGSIDGNFYTFNKGHLYKHNATESYNTFYGATAAASTIELIFNQSASVNKNFYTINYEGTNTWDISTIETDTQDTGLEIKSNINAVADTDTIINLSAFKKYDEKYFANIINSSPVKSNEVVFGKDISGVKGHFMKVTLNNEEPGYQELFSISTNYNVNSY